jgi:porin
VADAQAQDAEMGFNTAFHGPDDFFSIYETGLTPRFDSANGPLQGAYRAGFWYDPRRKERFDDGTTKRDDLGFYLSFDQLLLKKNNVADDSQGLGAFARFGLADGEVNNVPWFWSLGAQYKGLVPSRDKDVVALGVARGILSRDAGFSASNETALELYYNAAVTPWMGVSPSIQYIFNPGGDGHAGDAVVVGLRLQIAF